LGIDNNLGFGIPQGSTRKFEYKIVLGVVYTIVHADDALLCSAFFPSRYWPWEEQSCDIIVGSWTNLGDQIDVVNMFCDIDDVDMFCVFIMGSWTNSGDQIDVVNMFMNNVSSIYLKDFVPTIWEITSAKAYR
jgi:hypothetical protein